jgi:hypothetical protein
VSWWVVSGIEVSNPIVQAPSLAAIQQQFANQPVLIEGPFQTKAQAEQFFNTGSTSVPGAKTYEHAPKSLFPNPLSGVQEIGDFFHRLTEKATWVRVVEVLAGGVLVYAGVRALAQGSPVVGSGARKSVTKPVRKVAKTAVKVAAPEARLAARTAAKRRAPKTTARVAAHRERVAKYGAKTPYRPPVKRPPTTRVSHIYHHKEVKPS